MTSHSQGHRVQPAFKTQYLAPHSQPGGPRLHSHGYTDSQGPRQPMYFVAPPYYGHPGQSGSGLSSNPRHFQDNISPHQSSMQSMSDISSQYSSSDRSRGFMVPIPAQESQQQLPRPQSAPSQMGDSHLENGATSGNTGHSIVPDYQWVAEPRAQQPPVMPGVLKLSWSSDTDVTSFEYQGPFSLDVIEGMIKVKEDKRRNSGQSTSSITMSTSSQNTLTESTVNSSSGQVQQSSFPPPGNMASTVPPGTNGNTDITSNIPGQVHTQVEQ